MHFSILVCIVLSFHGIVAKNGRSCYECTGASESSECIANPGEPRVCEKKYCTIYRREYIDQPGKIDNFRRSCEDNPGFLNTVIESTNHRIFYGACTEDLCNSGDGVLPNERTLRFEDFSYEDFTDVPGIGFPDGATLASANALLIFTIVIVVLLSRQN